MASCNSETLRHLLARRLSRRRLLGGAAGLAVTAAVGSGAALANGRRLAFPQVAPSARDAVIVPDGYRADIVLRWGDPLFAGVPALAPAAVARGALLEAGAADAQARQFGYNCDGIGLFPFGRGRWLIGVNHEFPSPAQLFPGWAEARSRRELGAFVREHPEAVAYMQAAVGLSMVELSPGARWGYRVGAALNRRFTAHSPFELRGPAASHPLLAGGRGEHPVAYGTLGNCAAGATPWGTYVSGEENVDQYFGNAAAASFTPDVARAHARLPLRQRDSSYRWEHVDPRFDAAAYPLEALKFGWIVEVDPFDPAAPGRKRTALGRFKHEGATVTVGRDGRVAVYMGDDEPFEYFYKFVARDAFDPSRPGRNRDLLDAGTLHVARFAEDGSGEWLPLVWRAEGPLSPMTGFASQADVLLRCREAADRLGATPLDRPEDVAVSPVTGKVYVACTQNAERTGGPVESAGRTVAEGGAAPASPRAPNPFGHIVEFEEAGGDVAAAAFRWEIFVLAGAAGRGSVLARLPDGDEPIDSAASYFAGAEQAAAFANPDNLGFDADGNLWIVTDGAQPNGGNNGCFVCPTDGEERGGVRQFMSGPVEAEIAGCEVAAGGRTLFLTVQHPGSSGTAEAPTSRWPDGGEAAPRPSLIAIEPLAPGSKLGD